MTSIADALVNFCSFMDGNEGRLCEVEIGAKRDHTKCDKVELMAMIPPIQKMDATLSQCVMCVHLSLSTNSIDKMVPGALSGCKNLKILSLGRNQIKKLVGLEDVGNTLEELWISYNHISTLDGIQPCIKLKNLFMSNNKLADWNEVKKCASLSALTNVLFHGNPMYEGNNRSWAMGQCLAILVNLGTFDGIPAIEGAEEEVEE